MRHTEVLLQPRSKRSNSLLRQPPNFLTLQSYDKGTKPFCVAQIFFEIIAKILLLPRLEIEYRFDYLDYFRRGADVGEDFVHSLVRHWCLVDGVAVD